MMFVNGLKSLVAISITQPFVGLWRFILFSSSLLLIAACGGGSSSTSMQDIENTLACSATDGATFTNNCTFNVFVEVLEGDDDDTGTDFFVPTQSSIMLPVNGEFTFGVCPEPTRPIQQGTGFVCNS